MAERREFVVQFRKCLRAGSIVLIGYNNGGDDGCFGCLMAEEEDDRVTKMESRRELLLMLLLDGE